MEGMDKEAIPDLDGWEAYCEECKAFREARRAQERDVGDGTEYFEFVCNTCHSILLTFQRLGTEKPERKPAEFRAASARCPHCGELNVSDLRSCKEQTSRIFIKEKAKGRLSKD